MNSLPDEIIYTIGKYLPLKERINIFYRVCGRKYIKNYFNEKENYCLLRYCIKNKRINMIYYLMKKINIFIDDYKYLLTCVETSKYPKIMNLFLSKNDIYKSINYEMSLIHCIRINHLHTLKYLMNLDTLVFTNRIIGNILFYYMSDFKKGVIICHECIKYFLNKIPYEQYIIIIKKRTLRSCYFLHLLREIPLEILIKKSKPFYAIYGKDFYDGDFTKNTGISLCNYRLHRQLKNCFWKNFLIKYIIQQNI
jgi:hypothetical protein